MYLLEETEEARLMRENVNGLLLSGDVANVNLALQTIEGGGFHDDFMEVIPKAVANLINGYLGWFVGKPINDYNYKCAVLHLDQLIISGEITLYKTVLRILPYKDSNLRIDVVHSFLGVVSNFYLVFTK